MNQAGGTTINVRVQAASVDKPHPQFGSGDFGKKIKTIKLEVPVELYCYKQTRTNNQGFETGLIMQSTKLL